MIATLGAMITVRVYPTVKDRDRAENGTDVRASVISPGPPGVVADWARTTDKPGRWLLIRKAKNGGAKFEAIEGDQGKWG